MAQEIDRASALPIYRQLANWMETQILTGHWTPDERLPGEIELSRALSVSRGSLRKAISMLISKNLVVQVHGKGTFVAPAVVEQTWASRLVAISEEFALQGIPFTRKLLDQRVVPASASEAQSLDLAPGAPVLSVRRLWMVNNGPGLINESVMDDARFHALTEDDLEKTSIFQLFHRRFSVRLEWATHAISILHADAGLADYLQIKLGEPVLYDEQVTYDDHDRKILLVRGWYRSDRFRLHTVVHRHPEEQL